MAASNIDVPGFGTGILPSDLTLPAGDTYPPLFATVTDASGNPINLTAASQVKLVMTSATTPTQVFVVGVASVASAVGGFLAYNWVVGDTNTPDIYLTQIKVAWSAGGIETFPSTNYRTVTIGPNPAMFA